MGSQVIFHLTQSSFSSLSAPQPPAHSRSTRPCLSTGCRSFPFSFLRQLKRYHRKSFSDFNFYLLIPTDSDSGSHIVLRDVNSIIRSPCTLNRKKGCEKWKSLHKVLVLTKESDWVREAETRGKLINARKVARRVGGKKISGDSDNIYSNGQIALKGKLFLSINFSSKLILFLFIALS